MKIETSIASQTSFSSSFDEKFRVTLNSGVVVEFARTDEDAPNIMGTALNQNFQINTLPVDEYTEFTARSLDDGGFIAFWIRNFDSPGVYSQKFNENLTRSDGEVKIDISANSYETLATSETPEGFFLECQIIDVDEYGLALVNFEGNGNQTGDLH